jgi:hypothetical protein
LDESFCLAIRSRPIRPREDVLDPDALNDSGVKLGSVAGAVVGHDPLHGDAPSCEPGDRSF